MEKKKEQKEFSREDLEIAELPEREAMALLNINGNLKNFLRFNKLKIW